MRSSRIKISLLVSCIFCAFRAGFLAGQELPEIVQVTTHPSPDYAPVVSPDGKWLAAVSERSGNPDIWVKRLPRGLSSQVTLHPSDDLEPAWSPDSKRLVFVSKRRDAAGDLWLIKLDMKRGGIPHGDPVQLTHYLGADRNPSFSPDGGKIVFVSDRSGRLNLWIFDLSTNKESPLTTDGGTEPCWSPAGDWILFTSFSTDPGGHLALVDTRQNSVEKSYSVTMKGGMDGQGKWSPDGRKIVFRRFADDTNDDGAVTIEDQSSIWQKSIDIKADESGAKESLNGIEIQITPESERAQNPCFGLEGQIYFDSEKEKGQDIWSIPEDGLFRRSPSAQEQYEAVWIRFGEATFPEPLAYSILGYRRVLDYFPQDSVWCSRALLRMGETYQVLSRPRLGRQNFELVRTRYHNQKREAASAALKLAGFPDEQYEKRLSLCRAVIHDFSEDPSVQAEAWILLGDLCRDARNTTESLASYGRVLQLPASRNWKAQAQLKLGDLFLFQGQGETAQQSYLAVLKEYGDIPIWRDRAGKRLLDQIRGSSQERIAQYQQMIQQFSSMPSLIAEAQLAIAGELRNEGQFDQAFYELENMEALVPGLLWAHAKAKILQAQLRSLAGDDLKGIFLLENVIQNLGTVEGGRYAVEANDSLFSLLYRSAERLKASGDVQLAGVRYKKALELRYGDVACHRGWVECLFRTDRIEEALKDYEERLKAYPRDPVLLYGMGLALSYQGEKNAGLLNKSNDWLALSLDENYRLVPPYRTMGFNYEALEKLEEQKKQQHRGFLARTGKMILSPIRWAAGFLPFGRPLDKTGYYEKAIQVLSTALELNDEQTDPQMEARLAQNLANNFYNLGEYGYAKAFQYYRLRFSMDSTFTSLLEKALLYERAGHTALFIQEIEPAAAYLNEAVLTYADLGREEESLLSMRRLAMLNYQAGKYGEAVQIYQALATRDEKANRLNELELDYRNIAFNSHLVGENEDALSYALKAEQIIKTWHIPEKPPKKDKLRFEILGFSIPVPFIGVGEIGGALAEGFTLADEAAMVWGLISRSCEALKHMDESIAYEQKRLSLFRNRKDGFAERISLNRLGLLYYKSARFSEAWTHFALSREASKKKKINDAPGAFINTINLANVAMVEMGNLGKEDHFSQAVQYLEEEHKKGGGAEGQNRRERMMLSNALGAVWLLHAKAETLIPNSGSGLIEAVRRFSELARAEPYFLESLKLARDEGDGRHEAAVLKNLAETNARAGDRDEAVSFMKQSLAVLESIQDREWTWRIRAGLAGLEAGQGPDKENGFQPEDLFEQAMSEIESLPVQEEGSEELLSDRKERVDLYTHAAIEAADRGEASQSLEIAERGKEKELADMLARRPPELKRERHKVAWGNVRFYRNLLMRLREQARTEKHDRRRAVLQDSLDRRGKEYRQVLVDIREEDPVLAAIAGALPIDLNAARSILSPDGAALVYLSGEDKTLVWFVDGDTVLAATVPFGSGDLKKRAESLWTAILKDSSAVKCCGEWYDILIRPVESLIAGKRRLVIVPDKAMWVVPFEALWSGEAFLSERFELVYSPSLFAYWLAWNRRRINFRNGVLVGEGRDEALLGPISELGTSPVPLLGPRATESALKEQAREADLIQIEKWIVPDQGQPLRSALFLSPDSVEDGAVHAWDLFQWDVKASLVQLPYAVAKDNAAFRPDAFFYALCYAGVPTVGLTSWPVDRETKLAFERAFYAAAKRLSFGGALQEAASLVRKDRPGIRFWAGFKLVGFEGMDAKEKIAFAEENLSKTVLEARAYEQKQEYEDALDSFEKALSMSEAVRDTMSMVNLWKETVRIGMKGKLWNKAVSYQMKLIQHAERNGDSTAALNGYRNLSAFCVQNNWFEAAAQAKTKVIDLLEKQGRKDLIPAQTEELAFIYERDRKYARAVSFAQMAYEQYDSMNQALGSAKALIRKGRFLLEAEQIWAARQTLQTGIDSLDSLAKNENDRYELASGYSLLGLVCEKLAQYDEGFRNQEKALAIFRNLGRTTQAAQTQQYLANLYWKTGNCRMALLMQRKALDTFETVQNDKLLVMAYGTLGLIYSSLGDLVKAEEAEQKALDLTEKTNNLTDKGAILKNLGVIRIQQERPEQAMALFTRAAFIDSALGQESGLASDFRNIGSLFVKMGKHRESVSLFRKGIAVSNRTGDKRNAVQCFFGLGQAFTGLGDKKSAAAVLDSGLAIAEPLQLPDLIWRLYRQRGKLFEESGQNQAAFQDYRNAVAVVEKQRAELKVSSFQQGFLDDKMDLYSDAIRLLCNTGQTGQAFDFVERAKSRNFIDLLGNQKPSAPKGQTDILASEQAARNLVQEAQDRLADLNRLTKDWTQKYRDEKRFWEIELEKRRKAYGNVLSRIQSESPELASFVSVDPLPVERVQALLPDSTALIEYYLSKDEIFTWFITSKTLSLSRVRVPAAEVENAVRKFRDAIQSRVSTDRENKALAEWLIFPFTKNLPGIRHAVFVPHGILHYLPFSALKDGNGRALIESFSMSLAPSATVLGYCMEKDGNRPSEGVLAVANPDLGDEKTDLPFAEREVQALKRTYKMVRSYSGPAATEAAVRSASDNAFGLVHFACHGEYEPETPLFSALLLSPDAKDDGRLEAQEIFDMRFDCRLVVLSACETGLAKITRGDEVVGLARSFLFAGAPSVMTSLWKVDDLATAVLMKRFYRYLKQGNSRAEALRKAQVFVKETLNGHPSAWAAFHLTGDFR